jgi:hypothetical protein
MLCFIKEIAINIFLWCYFYASLRGQSGFHFTWICLLFVESCSWIFFNRIGKGSFFNIWPSVFSLGACNGNKWGREIYQDWKAFFTFNSGELYCSYAVLCECICRQTWILMYFCAYLMNRIRPTTRQIFMSILIGQPCRLLNFSFKSFIR